MDKEDKREILKALGSVGNVSFALVSSVIVGLLLGKWIDTYLDTFPWGTTVGIVFGMATGLWSIYYQIMNKK